MKMVGPQLVFLLCFTSFAVDGNIPKDYQGKPFQDSAHTSGPQNIPGRLEAALYDLGGEESRITMSTPSITAVANSIMKKGIAKRVCAFISAIFVKGKACDISCVKKRADLNHADMVTEDWRQLNIGWTEDGEWTNYTIDVKS